jgi:hypothetical protein
MKFLVAEIQGEKNKGGFIRVLQFRLCLRSETVP